MKGERRAERKKKSEEEKQKGKSTGWEWLAAQLIVGFTTTKGAVVGMKDTFLCTGHVISVSFHLFGHADSLNGNHSPPPPQSNLMGTCIRQTIYWPRCLTCHMLKHTCKHVALMNWSWSWGDFAVWQQNTRIHWSVKENDYSLNPKFSYSSNSHLVPWSSFWSLSDQILVSILPRDKVILKRQTG